MKRLSLKLGAWTLALSGVIIPTATWAAQQRPYDYWGWHPFWGTWHIGMMLVMLLFWGLVIVGLVLGIRWLITQGRAPHADSPLDILKRRYARGEIDRQEYEAQKQELLA
ncbi:MAG: SHOCT domain-containing protein [Candidatus Methylomirabilales bacterium]